MRYRYLRPAKYDGAIPKCLPAANMEPMPHLKHARAEVRRLHFKNAAASDIRRVYAAMPASVTAYISTGRKRAEMTYQPFHECR